MSPEMSRALSTLNPPAGHAIRTWVGMGRSESGAAAITFAWETAIRGKPLSVSLHAKGGQATVYYHGSVGANSAVRPKPGTSVPATPRPPDSGSITFDALPGPLHLSILVGSGAAEQTITQSFMIPDYWDIPFSMDTPRVFRARTPQELRDIQENPNAVPAAGRDFVRSDRLVVRLGAHVPPETPVTFSARLLTRGGEPLANLPVSDRPRGVAWAEIDFPLGNVAAGEYVVEINATDGEEKDTELVALRVGR
jgi:hypothetical protein